MPKRRGSKNTYPATKRHLKALGVWKGSLSKRLENMRGSSIPQMYPKIKGTSASNYKRVGKPWITEKKYRNPARKEYNARKYVYTPGIGYEYVNTGTKHIPPSGIIDFKLKQNIRRQSRKVGRGGRGGRGAGANVSTKGSAAARRVKNIRANIEHRKLSGREKKKAPKSKPAT